MNLNNYKEIRREIKDNFYINFVLLNSRIVQRFLWYASNNINVQKLRLELEVQL